MKITFKKGLLAAIAALTVCSARADEGMWLLQLMKQQNSIDMMKKQGLKLEADDLYNPNGVSLKDAVGIFGGGCTGEIISPEGLILTNHHCGYGAIQQHSSVEHDYLTDGFWAMNRSEELPTPGLKFRFVHRIVDITDLVNAKIKAGEVTEIDALTSPFLNKLAKEELEKSDLKGKPGIEVRALPFYAGNKFYMFYYKVYSDVRMVAAPPSSVGKFGGETDNWMWPRQTCDFSVFRIYADPKTNGPAAYSENNVPYHPKHWAPVSLQGYKDGDFAMTMGYPGSTNRYLSSYGIKQMRDAENTPRAQVRGVKQDVMIRHMRADEAVRIKYDSKYAQSSNYWKNSLGMNKCIDSIGIINQKQQYEKLIRAYQDSTGYLKGKLDFSVMENLYGRQFDVMRNLYYFMETFRRTNELATRAMRVNQGIEVKGPKNKPSKQYVEFDDNSDTWDEALDKEVYAVLLKNYRGHVNASALPEFYKTIDVQFGGDYAKYVDYLWANSILMKKGKKIYFTKKEYKNDLGVQMGMDLVTMWGDMIGKMRSLNDSIGIQEKYLCAAKLRMEEDMPHYSDANFTMRLSYGQVGGFTLNGAPSGYYTTAESIVEKMNKADKMIDYVAEPIMKELLSAPSFGKYQDKTTGKMQLCFLTNNDITGGNSGSPMFNGNGELIGLAFDGNWDSLSSDIFFDRTLARCIGVDIRFVLFMMDKWGHADRLLKEINAK